MLRAQAVGIKANGKTAFMREQLRSRVVVPGVAASAVSESSTPEPETAAAAVAETAAAAAAETATAAEQHTSPPRRRAAAAAAAVAAVAAAQSTAPFDRAQHAGNAEDAEVEGGADNADNADNVAGSAEIIARQQAEITTSRCKIAALEAEIREASSSRSTIEQQLKRVQAHNEVPVTDL